MIQTQIRGGCPQSLKTIYDYIVGYPTLLALTFQLPLSI